MERKGYYVNNDRNYVQPSQAEGEALQPEETVEFRSEMPQVSDDDVEFIPDERLEEEVSEEI